MESIKKVWALAKKLMLPAAYATFCPNDHVKAIQYIGDSFIENKNINQSHQFTIYLR